MQKFRQLIHQAFSKIDASNPKMRQRVYENIWLMQEKSLAAQNWTNAQKQEKRQHLTQLLKTVEMDYRANAPAPAMPPETGFAFPQAHGPNKMQSPAENGRFAAMNGLKAERDKDPSLFYLEQEVNRKVPENPAEAAPSSLRRIKPGAYIIGILAVLVAVFVVWSFYNSFGTLGMLRKQQALSTAPMQQNNYGKNGWTEVFNPANVTGLAVQGRTAADLHNEPDANFIRITAYKPEDMATIEIGQGALMPLRGKTATFKLVARNADNTIGQLNLIADFGNGSVSRYRFELSPTAAPLLFRVAIPQKLNQPAKFYIGGDIKGKQYQADIFSLLLRESDEAGH